MSSREWIAGIFSTLPLAALASFLAPPTVADTEARGEELKPLATSSQTNLRKAPGMNGEILAGIPKGTTVEVGDCRNGWCRVSWSGLDGYAIARNFDTASPLRWPNPAVAAWQDDGYGQRQKSGKIDVVGGRERGGADHSFILEIGTAGEWPLNGERPNFGGTIAAEIEPIENWLELEFGLSMLATAGHTELSGDILFKKPFRLSPSVEFMIGAGPSLSRTFNGPEQGNSWSVEFALDWMFWPTKNLGWFIEPTWSVNPKNGQQSAAVSIGILIGFPQ
jgi:hypothetical protein